jgi:uncharacterized membrane protein
MRNLSDTGRMFYGIAIAGMGAVAIYYHHFPYILPIPEHFKTPGLTILAVIWGIMFALAGVCIVFNKRNRQISLLFGSVLLLIFCLYYIPYQFLVSSNYMHLEDWENAEKELALAGGALVIAGCFSKEKGSRFTIILGKLIPFGTIFFAIPIISFGILHFMYGKAVAGMVPAWIPGHLFWIYFAGAALIGSGVAIILKIRTGLIASLLGTMIFLWFILLHIPRVIASPVAYIGDEIFSAFLALAYSGIAFVIAWTGSKQKSP